MVGRVSADQGGLAAFTPTYGAPEQWLPKRFGQTGPWTDVFGFALCVVEALTGKAPFDGDVPALMGACINEAERPTPLAFGVRLPERAEAAFRKALAVDPVERYQDVGEFWDEIEAVAGHVTPRITATQGFTHDSLLPPAMGAPQPSSLLTELGATERLPAAALPPELTLGLGVQSDADPFGGPKARVRAAPAPAAGLRSLDETQGAPIHLSLMAPGSVRPPPGSRRGAPLAGLAVARTANVRALPSEAPTMDSVLTRMLPGLRLIAIGVVIMIADTVYALVNGEPLRFGPARALWIAGPLVGYGIVKLVLALAG
jgi:serine/threonine-protein kinase